MSTEFCRPSRSDRHPTQRPVRLSDGAKSVQESGPKSWLGASRARLLVRVDRSRFAPRQDRRGGVCRRNGLSETRDVLFGDVIGVSARLGQGTRLYGSPEIRQVAQESPLARVGAERTSAFPAARHANRGAFSWPPRPFGDRGFDALRWRKAARKRGSQTARRDVRATPCNLARPNFRPVLACLFLPVMGLLNACYQPVRLPVPQPVFCPQPDGCIRRNAMRLHEFLDWLAAGWTKKPLLAGEIVSAADREALPRSGGRLQFWRSCDLVKACSAAPGRAVDGRPRTCGC